MKPGNIRRDRVFKVKVQMNNGAEAYRLRQYIEEAIKNYRWTVTDQYPGFSKVEVEIKRYARLSEKDKSELNQLRRERMNSLPRDSRGRLLKKSAP